MMKIKSYTDINQSRKLAEILPIESADMLFQLGEDKYADDIRVPLTKKHWEQMMPDINPCWSLAVLFDILPNEIITDNRFECHYQIDIRKYDSGSNITLYQIAYGNNRGSSGSWHDMINTGEKEHLIDACYQMILKLHELKML